jgi:hypothetical protein
MLLFLYFTMTLHLLATILKSLDAVLKSEKITSLDVKISQKERVVEGYND